MGKDDYKDFLIVLINSQPKLSNQSFSSNAYLWYPINRELLTDTYSIYFREKFGIEDESVSYNLVNDFNNAITNMTYKVLGFKKMFSVEKQTYVIAANDIILTNSQLMGTEQFNVIGGSGYIWNYLPKKKLKIDDVAVESIRLKFGIRRPSTAKIFIEKWNKIILRLKKKLFYSTLRIF